MRRAQWLSLIVGLWVLLALPVAAQSGSVRIEDPAGLLGGQTEAIRQAAQRLAGEGAEVLVVAAGPEQASDQQSSDAYLNQFVQRITPNQIIFYVAPNARQTSLRFGQRWNNVLRPVEREIQAQQMNPRFYSGDLAGGMIAGIDATRTTINPPNTAFYVIGGALAVAAIGVVALPMLRRRRDTATTLAGARERMEQFRRAAGGAIADLGRVAEQAQAKAQYDRLSYSKADAERVQQLQAQGMQLFTEAQAAFDAAEEQQHAKATLAAADYDSIAARYEQAQEIAQRAATAIGEAEQHRAMLDARGAPSTGATTRLGE